MKYFSGLVLLLMIHPCLASDKTEIFHWQDDRGVDNFTHFKPDEYGVIRQDDTPIDYGREASRGEIQRFLLGEWGIPEYAFRGDVDNGIFSSGSIKFNEDGSYLASYQSAAGYAVSGTGSWILTLDNLIKIRGVISIGIEQTSFSETHRVRYIDNRNMVLQDEYQMSYQYVRK